jgi:hypothetical protein
MPIPQNASLDFLNVNRPLNLPDPVNAGDAANMRFVLAQIEGLWPKDNVRTKSSANVNLASPGSSIGAVTLDRPGVDRVLAADQTNPAENGIYVWNGPSTAMVRSFDANSIEELKSAVTRVDEGSSSDTTWRQTTVNGTLGTTAIQWIPFGTSAPAASESTPGISAEATQAETDAQLITGKFVSPGKLGNWPGRKLEATAVIGDGTALVWVVTHGFNSYDVVPEVYKNSGARASIDCNKERTSLNAVTFTFEGVPPGINEFKAVILG